jgi:hypothetical protein
MKDSFLQTISGCLLLFKPGQFYTPTWFQSKLEAM